MFSTKLLVLNKNLTVKLVFLNKKFCGKTKLEKKKSFMSFYNSFCMDFMHTLDNIITLDFKQYLKFLCKIYHFYIYFMHKTFYFYLTMYKNVEKLDRYYANMNDFKQVN